MKTTWARMKATDAVFTRTMNLAGGVCEGKTGPRALRCALRASEVIEFYDTVAQVNRAAMCVECRKVCFGELPAERAVKTKAFKARQAPMFEEAYVAPTHRIERGEKCRI